MASAKQIEANQRNAARSTGPRTLEGKLRSRENSVIHGCAAHEIHTFSWEDPEEYASLLTGFTASWKPANAQEHHLVSLIADAAVRIRRAEELELTLIEGLAANYDATRREAGVNSVGPQMSAALALGEEKNEKALGNVNRYIARAHTNYNRSCETLRRLQKDRQLVRLRDFQLHEAQLRYQRRTTSTGEFPEPNAKLASFGRQPETPCPPPSDVVVKRKFIRVRT